MTKRGNGGHEVHRPGQVDDAANKVRVRVQRSLESLRGPGVRVIGAPVHPQLGPFRQLVLQRQADAWNCRQQVDTPSRAEPTTEVRHHLCAHGQEYRTSEYHPATSSIIRDQPRETASLPVAPWAGAYGFDRDPGSDTATIPLLGPGAGFNRGYAMTADLTQPVIIATLPVTGDEPAPLLIDGSAPPVTVRSEAVAAVCRYPVTLGRLSWGSACVRGSQTMPMSFGWIWGQEE